MAAINHHIDRHDARCTDSRETHGGAAPPPTQIRPQRAAYPLQTLLRMTNYRRGLHIGAIIAGLTTAWAPSLAAQGGQKARSAPDDASATSATSAVAVELAGGLLKTLMGSWRFEVRFAGNFTGAPDAAGIRVFAVLYDELRLEWTESLDSSTISARGIVGFDPRTGEFYSTTVNSSGPGIELLAGSMDLSEPLVLFTPSSKARDASYTLRVIDADHFMWAPLDRGWRAVFTRDR
jgi:hypothetical protein